MNRSQWWVDSGQAANAAQGLVWFVVVVFIAVGFMMWRDMRKEGKGAQKQAAKGKAHKAD